MKSILLGLILISTQAVSAQASSNCENIKELLSIKKLILKEAALEYTLAVGTDKRNAEIYLNDRITDLEKTLQLPTSHQCLSEIKLQDTEIANEEQRIMNLKLALSSSTSQIIETANILESRIDLMLKVMK